MKGTSKVKQTLSRVVGDPSKAPFVNESSIALASCFIEEID